MKKVISIIIWFIIFAIWCIPISMAKFYSDDMNSVTKTDVCCDAMSWDCNEDKHECCISPFKDSTLNLSNISTSEEKNNKWKILDFDFFALIQQSSESNYIDKLTSPPKSYNYENNSNWYIALTGIIKSNC